jgi:hypothetical protein
MKSSGYPGPSRLGTVTQALSVQCAAGGTVPLARGWRGATAGTAVPAGESASA